MAISLRPQSASDRSATWKSLRRVVLIGNSTGGGSHGELQLLISLRFASAVDSRPASEPGRSSVGMAATSCRSAPQTPGRHRIAGSVKQHLAAAGQAARLRARRRASAARRFGLIGTFPGEFRLLAAEVAVGGGLLVDRPREVEHLAQAVRRQIEIAAYQRRSVPRATARWCRTSRP